MPRPLTQKQALACAQRKFGRSAYVEDKGRRLGPSSPERRAEARAIYDAHLATEPKLRPIEEWPPETPIGEYLAAKRAHAKAWKAWRAKKIALGWQPDYRRFSVGEDGFLVRHIRGQGDSWEEALAEAGCPVETPAQKRARTTREG